MRIFSILLFSATLGLGVSELVWHSFGSAAAARTQTKVWDQVANQVAAPAQEPRSEARERVKRVVVAGKTNAQVKQQTAERNAKPFLYVQMILTIILVPFCMFLVLVRYQDQATKRFGFTSLGAIIAFWFYIPKG